MHSYAVNHIYRAPKLIHGFEICLQRPHYDMYGTNCSVWVMAMKVNHLYHCLQCIFFLSYIPRHDCWPKTICTNTNKKNSSFIIPMLLDQNAPFSVFSMKGRGYSEVQFTAHRLPVLPTAASSTGLIKQTVSGNQQHCSRIV